MFEALTAEAKKLLQSYGEDAGSVSFSWRRPAEPLHGDLTTMVALQLARILKKPPRIIAGELMTKLNGHADIERIEVAGAGYINVWLTPAALIGELAHTRTACVPAVTRTKEKPVIVEYSGPNIAKPLGIHHIMGTVVGQAIANLYRHAGFSVVTWNYLGDWGTQFGKLAIAMQKWGDAKKSAAHYTLDELLALYVRFHAEGEKDAALEDRARETFRALEKGDPVLKAFWKDVVTVTQASLGNIYRRLRVSFDCELGESFYQDKMEPIIREGIEKRVFTEGKEGALIVEFSEESQLPPYMIRKGDGATLYSTRDLAQMRYRIDTYHPAAIYIVTDVAQKLHFEQLVATCGKLGWELPMFENLLLGRMRFAEKKMSTRTGNILKLEHVLDEAVKQAEKVIEEHGDRLEVEDPHALAEIMGVGALAYGIVSQNRAIDIVFDWDKMLSFEGNSAPYLQYTHARARSVLRKAADDEHQPSSLEGTTEVRTLTAQERVLLQTLLEFPTVLEDARRTHLPHTLAHFLYRLCQDFNAFYNADPILKAEPPTRALRLSLTDLSASVLRTGAELLTLRVPERM